MSSTRMRSSPVQVVRGGRRPCVLQCGVQATCTLCYYCTLYNVHVRSVNARHTAILTPPLTSPPFLAHHNASSIHKMMQLCSITMHKSLLFPSVGRGKCIHICTCLASRFVPLGCIVNCAVNNSLILISHFYKHYPINSRVFERCITLCCLVFFFFFL